MRTIFHIDMDAFFVSVEELYDPSLKGKPVVVGGKGTERGVVSAASYAARKYGVHSAMPLRTAAALCPQAIFVDGHRDRYELYSGKVRAVLESFTPRFEMASIDEAYLDMTGTERLHGPPLAAAHKLHEAIRQATGLNNSIGCSTARLVSKVASDQAKPNGVLWIPPGSEAAFLAPLDIRKIPGVGKVSEKNLQDLGIYKVGDVTFKRGIIGNTAFFNWIKDVRNGEQNILSTVTVDLYDEAHQGPVMTWTLTNARPIKYTGVTLNAKGGTDVAIEELVISSEKLDVA